MATDSSFIKGLPGCQNLDVDNTTNRNVAGLSPNRNYYYRLRAYNGNGTSPNPHVTSKDASLTEQPYRGKEQQEASRICPASIGC
jgi:phosphodiesterase/alkaline phosphatase D-like protein